MKLELEPIGYLQSCYKQKFGTPRQSGLAATSWASLTLEKKWHNQGLFDGLENFTHVWLIGFFHKNENKVQKGKIRPPKMEGKKLGVLASRSPHRPNAVSLTVARIDSIKGNTVILRGADLIEGTPILDIKPYMPAYDRLNDAQSTLVTDTDVFEVQFKDSFLSELRAFKLPLPEDEFLDLIRETLRLDPRPNVYKKLGPDFAFTLFDWDIGFIYRDKKIIVETVQLAGSLRTLTKATANAPKDQSKERQPVTSKNSPRPRSNA